jgi:hypothetical protein
MEWDLEEWPMCGPYCIRSEWMSVSTRQKEITSGRFTNPRLMTSSLRWQSINHQRLQYRYELIEGKVSQRECIRDIPIDTHVLLVQHQSKSHHARDYWIEQWNLLWEGTGDISCPPWPGFVQGGSYNVPHQEIVWRSCDETERSKAFFPSLVPAGPSLPFRSLPLKPGTALRLLTPW